MKTTHQNFIYDEYGILVTIIEGYSRKQVNDQGKLHLIKRSWTSEVKKINRTKKKVRT